MNEPLWRHSRAQVVITSALEVWAVVTPDRGQVGAPIDVQLDERNVRAPDVVWYRDGRAPSLSDSRPYPIPDLAVEIRSPSTWLRDTGVKKASYERCGVAELWLVDTDQSIVLVSRRSSAKATLFDVSLELTVADSLTSPLLPGFSLPVGEIFAD